MLPNPPLPEARVESQPKRELINLIENTAHDVRPNSVPNSETFPSRLPCPPLSAKWGPPLSLQSFASISFHLETSATTYGVSLPVYAVRASRTCSCLVTHNISQILQISVAIPHPGCYPRTNSHYVRIVQARTRQPLTC
jgi:hypothetical protein